MERARTAKAGGTARTLVKEGPLRITLVALLRGVSLQEHQVAGGLRNRALLLVNWTWNYIRYDRANQIITDSPLDEPK